MTKLKTLVVATAAAATMAVGIMPANAAAPKYTVSAGNASTGTVVNITGTTTGATPQINFTTSTGLQLGCDSGTAPGKTTVGSNLKGRGIASITGPGTTWKNCVGPLGLKLTVHGIGAWQINAKSYSAGVTTGTITRANANVTGSGCSFKVRGSVPITYTNSSQVLSVLDTQFKLKISNVSGCFGAISNGDTAAFQADYVIKAQPNLRNPVAITSP